jgi:DNA-binding NarL/FixJ family response regulator
LSASLTSEQLHRALNATAALAELRELEEFPARATAVLRELIPCEHCGYNAIDLETGHAVVVANPRETVFEGGPEILGRLGHQNPLIVRALAGERGVQRLSDHISRRDLHRTELYQDVYRRILLEFQLGLRLSDVGRSLGRSGQFVGLSLARHHRDFSKADMLMLDLLRPHFAATLERLHELALTRAVLAGTAADDRWVVLVDDDDVLAWGSEGAEQVLDTSVGERLSLNQQFRVRRVANAYPELHALHIARVPNRDPEALQRLGLTKRQAEVFALATRGLTAQQIGDTLVLSRRTVEKHFDAIYRRLGARNRSEAVAIAIEKLGATD